MSLDYAAAALSTEGEQLRYRGQTPGAYKVPLSELRSWAADNATTKAAVHALTHHGWHKGGERLCAESDSRAFHLASEAVRRGDLSVECFAPGRAVGPQIVACMRTLEGLGAPRSALHDLWCCYTGL